MQAVTQFLVRSDSRVPPVSKVVLVVWFPRSSLCVGRGDGPCSAPRSPNTDTASEFLKAECGCYSMIRRQIPAVPTVLTD